MRPGKKLVFASLCHGGRERRKKTKVLKKRRETKHFVVSSRGTNSSRRRTHKIMKHEASASEGVPHTWLDPSRSPSLVSTERSEGRRNKKKMRFQTKIFQERRKLSESDLLLDKTRITTRGIFSMALSVLRARKVRRLASSRFLIRFPSGPLYIVGDVTYGS